MSRQKFEDLGHLSMLELFRVEAENQTAILTTGLLELERSSATPAHFETLMRAAHSLKGAARIINLQSVVAVSHAIEDCFVAAQHGKLQLAQPHVDVLLRGVDLLIKLCKSAEAGGNAQNSNEQETTRFLATLKEFTSPGSVASASTPAPKAAQPTTAVARTAPSASEGESFSPPDPKALATRDSNASDALPSKEAPAQNAVATKSDASERVVRLTAENLNRLLGLAGESLVESRWLRPFAESLQRLKRQQAGLSQQLDHFRHSLDKEPLSERAAAQLQELIQSSAHCQEFLAARLEELDLFDRRSAHLSHRLYLEALRSRMRPFGEGVRRFPRMVRDLARSLGKEMRLEVQGENTQVDRDILERLETPLAHLLRNAVDHGCEAPEQRTKAGKAAEAAIRLDARHSAGMLVVTVADDGAGVDTERLRKVVIERRLLPQAAAEKLSESELLEFLFLPGFTLKETVTELSGRGVGLDVVQNMVKSVRGAIRVQTQQGRGLRIQLHLPLTLSVLRALLVEIGTEPYAIPLTQISRALKLSRFDIQTLEGRHYFMFGDQQVGLLTAHQVLDSAEPGFHGDELSVVVLGDRNVRYGIIVDRFLGERELVVQPIDPRLGKVTDISAAALMEDGSPVLIVDVDDLMRSIDKLVSSGRLPKLQRGELLSIPRKQKRILAVDDSLTVRELERKLLTSRGYYADVAVDGMDGWNAVRSGNYDLVVTDVDMPRMDGIELAALIKKDPHLKSLPVMIVSYKDHEEDRLRGLEAGADYYLSKGSFHDETLLQAVMDLIGEPDA
jgi:two-component system sensor histidine kinase and response regulator WspE